MYCYQLRSYKGEKYFQFCLNLRPLNAYVNFRYSIFLYKVVKNYKLSYYYLKLSKILNQEMFKIYVYKCQYKKIMKKLFLKLKKKHYCNNSKCNIDLTLNKNKQNKKRKCKGCNCVYYCSKSCQKKDWIYTHRKEIKECISKYLNPLSIKQQHTVDNLKYLLLLALEL